METLGNSSVLPLSAGQRALVFRQLLARDASHLNVGAQTRIRGPYDGKLLALAVQDSARRCDALRTVFRDSATCPAQEVLEHVTAPFFVSEHDDESSAMRWGTHVLQQPYELFDELLYRFALARVRGGDSHLFIGVHHAICDGWGIQVALARVCESYNALASGQVAACPPQFRDAFDREEKYRNSVAYERDAQYWLSRLAPRPAAPFGAHTASSVKFGLPDVRISTQIDGALYNRLCARAERVGASVTTALMAGLYSYMGRTFGTHDLVISSALLGRSTEAERGTVGLYARQALIRMSGGYDRPLEEILHEALHESRNAYRHSRFPVTDLAGALGGSLTHEWPRIGSLSLSLIPYPESQLRLGEASLSRRTPRVPNGCEPGPVHVSLQQFDPDRPVLDFFVNPSLLDPRAARELALGFISFLDGAANPATRRTAAVEKQSPPRLSLHDAVTHHAARTPDAVALRWKTGEMSYCELDKRSERLASHLQSRGVGADCVVALRFERGPEMVVALLAVLKAGGAYLPLDTELPPSRMAYMIDDARARWILTSNDTIQAVVPAGVECITVDGARDAEQASRPLQTLSQARDEHLAYVIYTSGSTGEPKGVQVRHAGLSNLLAAQGVFGVTAADRVIQFARLGFDASVWEMAMAFGSGATLCVLQSFADLAAVMAEERISVATLPPAALALLEGADLPQLRTLILAGEACSAEQVARWAHRCDVINAYGPTEATVCASVHRCVIGEAPPIGRAIANTQLHVLNDELEPVDAGGIGELCIGGHGLARGYSGRPALTAQRFVASPFERGRRLYRTGDKVRRRADGVLEFLGRIDQQVKVRGYRIEPGEIESVLLRVPAVTQAIVVARPDAAGQTRIEAHVCASDPALSARTLREQLREHLPQYMIPGVVVMRNSMPLTANGKIDRDALCATDAGVRVEHHEERAVAPATKTEQLLARIWCEVLGLESVGRSANFFELGATSLSLVRARGLLLERGARALEMTDFLAHPTIQRLARHLDGAAPREGIESAAAALRKRQRTNALHTRRWASEPHKQAISGGQV